MRFDSMERTGWCHRGSRAKMFVASSSDRPGMRNNGVVLLVELRSVSSGGGSVVELVSGVSFWSMDMAADEERRTVEFEYGRKEEGGSWVVIEVNGMIVWELQES